MNNSISFRDQLSGPHAFYKDPNYKSITNKEFSNFYPPSKASFTYYEENFITRVSKTVLNKLIDLVCLYGVGHFIVRRFVALPLSTYLNHYPVWNVAKWILIPLIVYRIAHAVAGIFILPASIFKLGLYFKKIFPGLDRLMIDKGQIADHPDLLKEGWVFKRISIDIDHHKIDAVIMGKPETLDNGKWTLVSRGNGEFYEHHIVPGFGRQIPNLLNKLNSNALIINYPAVFGSSGRMADCQETVKANRAGIAFLESIGAKKIILKSHSIGGGFQGEGFINYPFKKSIRYVAVSTGTFSDLGVIAQRMTGNRFVPYLLNLLGWKLRPIEASKTLPIPEIIVHNAQRIKAAQQIQDPNQVADDGVIDAESSKAKAVLKSNLKNKIVLGIPGLGHMDYIDPKFLAPFIEKSLAYPT